MAHFAYQAIDPQGKKVRGTLEAGNLAELEQRLLHMGLDLLRAHPRRARLPTRDTLPRRDVIALCFHLEQLTRAGVSLPDALTDLLESLEPGRLRNAVASLLAAIHNGRTLSGAMLEQPRAFSQAVCSLIRAGEVSGQLPQILAQLAAALKREDELAASAKKLAIYPLIMLAVILSALSVALLYLVPQLSTLFRSLGQTLPGHTRALISASEFAVRHWPLILGALVATVVGLRLEIHRNPRAARHFDALMLRLPIIGPVLKKILLARFASVFALMYAAGIPIMECLHACRTLSDNALLREAIDDAMARIREGVHLSAAFAQTQLFPSMVIRMLRVGESTGALDAALTNVNYFFERDVDEGISRAQSALEPALTLVLGALLLWVMISVLGPVYDILTRIKI